MNGTVQSSTTNTFTQNPSWDEAYQVDSIIKDNKGFYFLKSFEIPQLETENSFLNR